MEYKNDWLNYIWKLPDTKPDIIAYLYPIFACATYDNDEADVESDFFALDQWLNQGQSYPLG